MKRIGIDSQTVFGMPPIETIDLAASLGCGHVTLGLGPVPWKLDRFPAWSLRDDVALRRETKAALRNTAITVAAGEGCVIRAGVDVASYSPDIDLFAEIGAVRISTVTMEPDRNRATDQLGALVKLATERGLGVLLEFAPPHSINSLDLALATLAQIDSPSLKLTLDAMHYFRGGGTIARLANVAPALIGHVQICDAPLAGGADYYSEAIFNRLLPGEGALPLRDFVAAVPPSARIGIEIPMRARLDQGEPLNDLIAEAVLRTHAFIGRVLTSLSDDAAR